MNHKSMFGTFSILMVLLAGLWAMSEMSLAALGADGDKGIMEISSALEGKQYAEAASMADAYIKGNGKQQDQALYLKALAEHYAKSHEASIKSADQVIKEHPKSAWYFKALYLKAQNFAALKRFQEAETIYSGEAFRLLGDARKQEIAGLIVQFADALAKPADPKDVGAPPPNYQKAYNLYGRALGMEIGRAMRDQVMFKRARAIQQAGNPGQAILEFHAYLNTFDPDWMGPVGSAERAAGQKKENPEAAGQFIHAARHWMVEAELAAGQWDSARQDAQDLLTMLGKAPKAGADQTLASDTLWQIVKSYRMPSPSAGELEKGIKATQEFLAAYPKHVRSVQASWYIASAYQNHGRADQSVAAYEDFIAGKGYGLPDGDLATTALTDLKKSPAQLKDELEKQGLFLIGHIRFAQKQYAKAMEVWTSYVNKYPNGPNWADSQRGVINAEFEMAVEAVAQKEYDVARRRLDDFLRKYPLDNRSAQVLFIYGQMHYAQAVKLEDEKKEKAAFTEQYKRAVEEWEKLVSKFPGTEESSLALYRVGLIQEEKLGDLEKALESYRRLTWGSYAERARIRIALMTRKQLEVVTERKYKTDEAAVVKINARNISKLTFKQYFLDLEAYFRKTHGISGVDSLDIALIQPDKTWEVNIDNYAKYKPIEQSVEIPFPAGKAGVCIVNISEDDLEATTLVIRSDLDLVVKASRREILAYVQDMRLMKPAAGVELLLSDGKSVFATGKTGEDGVWRGKFDELKGLGQIGVFARRAENVASQGMSLSGMQLSSGLSARGYIYSDRPVYLPGQVVSYRGVIRTVKDGAYHAPAGAAYKVSVTDSQGRMLQQQEVKLSEFGAFVSAVKLQPGTPVGTYTITAREAENPAAAYSGTFEVQQFQLEKMKLGLEFDKRVYFRGETVEATVTGKYYWGEPVADKRLVYVLPDGRRGEARTDKEGKVKIKFDTSGLVPGSAMRFIASLEGESVNVVEVAQLALQGFNASVRSLEEVVLGGTPFDAEVSTTGADGKPIGQELTLTVLRRERVEPDPILSQVPWLRRPTRLTAEVTVQEKKIKTDEKTGKAMVKLELEKGGEYILRVSGEDRFKQVVTGQGAVRVSGVDDETKLRLFAESSTLKVGQDATVRLHSRLEKGIALITFEGEQIISHRVVPIGKDWNDLKLAVGHEHFPNFQVSVTVMDGKELRDAKRSFTVERQLQLVIKPKNPAYAPGAEAEVEIVVTDQTGKPVKADLSLALVDEALLSIWPDQAMSILDFFQRDARRHAEFRTATTADFGYVAITRDVIKAITEEGQRLATAAEEGRKLAELSERFDSDRKQLALRSRNGALEELEKRADMERLSRFQKEQNNDFSDLAFEDVQAGVDLRPLVGTNSVGFDPELNIPAASKPRAPAAPMPVVTAAGGEPLLGADGAAHFGNEDKARWAAANSRGAGAVSGKKFSEKAKGEGGGQGKPNDSFYALGAIAGDMDAAGFGFTGKAKDDASANAQTRREMPGAGGWIGSIVTDDSGKATVKMPLPQNTTQWRLTGRGVTVQTLAGQATSNVITRKDFFVETKSPASAMEGDKFRPLVRLHNLTDEEGEVEVKLSVVSEGRTYAQQVRKVKIGKGGAAETLMDEVEVPAGLEMDLVVEAALGQKKDKLAKPMTIRPWGMEYVDQAGGVAAGDTGATVQLPKGLKFNRRWLTVTVGPNIEKSVIEMALGHVENLRYESMPRVWGQAPGGELLAAISGLEYAKQTKAAVADYNRLLDRARGLVGRLVVSQRSDGGWSYFGPRAGSDWAITSLNYWALARSREQGVTVDDMVMARAETYLRNALQNASASDNEARALILHAQSVAKGADFAHLNRLHRQRNQMSSIAVAYTALAFANMGREEQAREMLAVLDGQVKVTQKDGKSLANWPGAPGGGMTDDEVESTAVALLAMVKSGIKAERLKQAADWLMDRKGSFGYPTAKSRGAAVAALASFFGAGRYQPTDSIITVMVNGKRIAAVESRKQQGSAVIEVPEASLIDGANSIRFTLEGRGEYAYGVSLRGFSQQLEDPKSWSTPAIAARVYHHATLDYRNRPISAASSSPVKNLEIGQRTNVRVSVAYDDKPYHGYLAVTEHLPAGAKLVADSLKGDFIHFEQEDGQLTLYYTPGQRVGSFGYELVGYSTGKYRVLPTVIRDALRPGRMRIGAAGQLAVLGPEEKSDDPYQMNNAERFALGSAYFGDGQMKRALEYLLPLWQESRLHNERETARMLMWIYTTEGFYDSKRIVEMFEVLRERYPTLEIPFQKILLVGKAYRDIGEFERAWLVYKATIDASFVNDSNVSAVLQDEGQFMGSIDFQEELWRQYPDTPQVAGAIFALSQALYEKAPLATQIAKQERRLAIGKGQDPEKLAAPTRLGMLERSIQMIRLFLTLYPENPLADDASFSLTNVFLDMKDYKSVVALSQTFRARFPDSDYAASFQYMAALGHFWQRQYEPALTSARVVAEGDSKDKPFAQYILGQIYHAQGKPADAIKWYSMVSQKYTDAREAIDYFQDKRIALEEVTIFRPGEAVTLDIKYRNIKDVSLQVYKVDLMKLYLREKNLSNIRAVNLAGIAPEQELAIKLGDGADYADKTSKPALKMKDEGAYLVICRGDSLFTSGLVLITPLKIEVQEEAESGRVRANVIDVVKNERPAQVHVKAIGSMDSVFRSGETDLRGIHVADNLRGKVTLIARDANSRYAFHRGDTWVGAPGQEPAKPQLRNKESKAPQQNAAQPVNFLDNLQMQNRQINDLNWKEYDQLRRNTSKGVEVQQAK